MIIIIYKDLNCVILIKMIIRNVSDRCNMTNEQYINQPMSMCERKIKMNIAKNPGLINELDRIKKHPLIRKYLHIPFSK